MTVVHNDSLNELSGTPAEEYSTKLRPLTSVPKLRDLESPAVVCALDKIRFDLEHLDALNSSDEHSEFTWFAREYPRCYRFHLNCADFRLHTISGLYRDIHAELASKLGDRSSVIEVSMYDLRVNRIYWDFESFLSEIDIALDLLARIVGTFYKDQMPPSFNRLCKKQENEGPLYLLKKAQLGWVNRLKDYRDCFVHYTPVDT